MNQSAAVVVLDCLPDADDIEEIVMQHLEEFTEEEASATTEILSKAPDWMDVSERDQVNAHVRDGLRGTCVLVIYMTEGSTEDT